MSLDDETVEMLVRAVPEVPHPMGPVEEDT
jgi:hypothetical protein